MPELPSGTVTFLFTDIERSTQTVGEVGDERYAELQDAHRQLLREPFAAHNGIEVGTEGDALFVAFARAGDAVAAAIDGQRALAKGSQLRVRMGLHTGEALLREGSYVGHDVHKAKRVSDAGHGGQVLLSQTTCDLVTPAVQVMDLGPHRLKDLREPQRLFQVIAEGLTKEFAPLRSLESFRHNLPIQRSSFVGRENEIASIRKLLESSRIVTLTGIGGCGKTRLAQHVGAELLERYPDGVFFCDLSAVSSPDVVRRTVASAVGVPAGEGGLAPVAPTGDRALIDFLKSRRCLLILDNCEHLLDASAELVDEVLSACPHVTFLATSREGLEVEGESSVRVPSMSLPDGVDDASSSEAVSLFATRGAEVESGFALTPSNIGAVISICRRVDGIPLAIEFAASRVSHLSPQEIDNRLRESFRLLAGGRRRVQRQATIEATLDWSFNLLSRDERLLLRRLSVFSGGFILRSAEDVCSGDGLDRADVLEIIASLVSKSLVLTEDLRDLSAYRLLETVRLYAAEKLRDAGEPDTFRDKHRDWYLALVEETPWEAALTSWRASEELSGQLPNLFAALEWSAASNRPDLVLRLVSRTYAVWFSDEYFGEGYRWATHVRPEDIEIDVETGIACLLTAAQCAIASGSAMNVPGQKRVDVAQLYDRAIALSDGTPSVPLLIAYGMRGMTRSVVGSFTQDQATIDGCRADIRRAADMTPDLPSVVAGLAPYLEGYAEATLDNLDGARRAITDAVNRMDPSKNRGMFSWARALLATIRHVDGDHEAAALVGEEIVMDLSYWEDTGIKCTMLSAAAAALAGAGKTERAKKLLLEYLDEIRRSNTPGLLEELMVGVAVVAALAGHHGQASRLLWWVRSRTLDRFIPLRTPVNYVTYRYYVKLIRAALGHEDAARAREEGRAMSESDAYALAMEVLVAN